MKIKTIEQIKHEYSCNIANKESTFNEYISFILFTRNTQLFNDSVNIISHQYSLQFKQQNDILMDRVKELEECLEVIHHCVDWTVSSWGDDNGQLLKERIESLINKGK